MPRPVSLLNASTDLPVPLARSHVVFAGGVTGGHLFPGLAVAEQLAQLDPDLRITFAGTGTPFERRHVDRAGFNYFSIVSRRPSRSPWRAVRFAFDQWAATREASRYIGGENVSLVVGLGAFASLPMARAAAAASVPLVLLEQNVIAGRATTWLSSSATLICAAFEQVRGQLRPSCPLRITGNPIRHRFNSGPTAERPEAQPRRARRLVILGGSRGAKVLNEQVPRALYKLGGGLRGWDVLHQTGDTGVDATRSLYKKLGVPASVVSFIHDVSAELSRADLAICRAGGTTLAELAAAALPAVLVPYPHATADHQRQNADAFAADGAAIIVDSREINGRLDNHLADALRCLISDERRRQTMSAAMRRRARPDAAWQVATMIRDLLPEHRYRAAG